MRLAWLLLPLASVLFVSSGCKKSSDALPGGQAFLDIAYADGVEPLQRLDVYVPPHASNALMPVVVWVHGGGWHTGDKANNLDDKVRYFGEAGEILVSVNYRLSPEDEALDPSRIKFPLHEEDVSAAVAWVHAHVAEYGGDPTRIAVLGHSAGAQLVALLGTDERFLGAHGLGLGNLRCVGSFDTEGYEIVEMMKDATADVTLLYTNAFGADPAVWAEASASRYVAPGKGIPPFLIVRRGVAYRQMAQQSFRDLLVASQVTAAILDAQALSHEEVNEHIGQRGDEIMTPPLTRFLSDCFR